MFREKPFEQMHFKPKPFMRRSPEIDSHVDIDSNCADDFARASRAESVDCPGSVDARATVNVDSSGDEAHFEELFRRKRGCHQQRKRDRQRRRRRQRKRKLKLKSLGTKAGNLRAMHFVKKSLSRENRRERESFRQCFRVDEEEPRRRQVINLVEGRRPHAARRRRRRPARVLRPFAKKRVEMSVENLQNVTVSSEAEQESRAEAPRRRSPKGFCQAGLCIPSNPLPQDLDPPAERSRDRGDAGVLLENGVKLVSAAETRRFRTADLDVLRPEATLEPDLQRFFAKRGFSEARSFHSELSLEGAEDFCGAGAHFQSLPTKPRSPSQSRRGEEGEDPPKHSRGNPLDDAEKQSGEPPKQAGAARVGVGDGDGGAPKGGRGSPRRAPPGVPGTDVRSYIRRNKRFFQSNPGKAAQRLQKRGGAVRPSSSFKRKKKFLPKSNAPIGLHDVLSCFFPKAASRLPHEKQPLARKFGRIYDGKSIFAKSRKLKQQIQRLMRDGQRGSAPGAERGPNAPGKALSLGAKREFLRRLSELGRAPRPEELRLLLAELQSRGGAPAEALSEAQRRCVERDFTECLAQLSNMEALSGGADLAGPRGDALFARWAQGDAGLRDLKCFSSMKGDYCDLINLFYHACTSGFVSGEFQRDFSGIELLFPPKMNALGDRERPHPVLRNKCFCPPPRHRRLKRVKKKGPVGREWPQGREAAGGKGGKDKKCIPITNLEKSDSSSIDARSERAEQGSPLKQPKRASPGTGSFSGAGSRGPAPRGEEPCTEGDRRGEGGAAEEAAQVREMEAQASSKVQKFLGRVRLVDSFLLEKLFGGKWDLCLLELSKFFEGPQHLERFFSLVQLVDGDFYWLFRKPAQREGGAEG